MKTTKLERYEMPKVTVVDRLTWFRGHGPKPSFLLRRNKMTKAFGTQRSCCIGFSCLQAGVPQERLINQGTLSGVGARINALTRSSVRSANDTRIISTQFAYKAFGINDNDEITDVQREQQLKKLFATKGLEIEFVNWYPANPNIESIVAMNGKRNAIIFLVFLGVATAVMVGIALRPAYTEAESSMYDSTITTVELYPQLRPMLDKAFQKGWLSVDDYRQIRDARDKILGEAEAKIYEGEMTRHRTEVSRLLQKPTTQPKD